jgi:hypothetical protein
MNDYGSDPLGPDDAGIWRWRLVPSGEVVDRAELERRLGKPDDRPQAKTYCGLPWATIMRMQQGGRPEV